MAFADLVIVSLHAVLANAPTALVVFLALLRRMFSHMRVPARAQHMSSSTSSSGSVMFSSFRSSNTWEPKENVGFPDLVEEFEESQRQSNKGKKRKKNVSSKESDDKNKTEVSNVFVYFVNYWFT